MIDKPFLNIDEQIEYLNKSKNILTTKEDKVNLIRIGYFNLINGYKAPFCSFINDKGRHVYEKGTTIKNIIALNDFDNKLRCLLFKTLIKIEQEIRSVTSYFFEKTKNNKLTWRSNKAYNPQVSIDKRNRLISQIINELNDNSKKCLYINFYKTNHKNFPMWIVTKSIKLTTFISLFDIANDDVYLNVCDVYKIDGEDDNRKKQNLKSILHWIRIVRNACAHNERTYCIQGYNRLLETEFKKLPKSYRRSMPKQRILDVLIYCRYFLNKDEFYNLIIEVKDLIIELQGKISIHSFNQVRAQLGLKRIDDLDLIANDGFDKNYLLL